MSFSPGFAVVASGYKKNFHTIDKSGILLRSLHKSLASARCSSTSTSETMTPGKMSNNIPPWIPVFAAVGDNTLPCAEPKCLLRIVSYNILAQAYVKSTTFPTSPRASLRWKNRSVAVVSCLLSLDADLLCLQEVDEFHTFYKEALCKEGYGNVYIQRGNHKRDGCGIFFRHSKLSLLAQEAIDYNDLVPPLPEEESEGGTGDISSVAAQKRGDLNDVRVRLQRDCVGIIAAFRPVAMPARILIVVSTHIFWDPVLMDVKLAQVRYLAERVLAFQKTIEEEFNVEPLLFIAGDFNSLPGDTVYKYVTSGVDQAVKFKAVDEDLDESLEGGPSISPDQSAASSVGRVEVEWMTGCLGRFPLPLVSLYAYVDKEPTATNYTHNFVGTLDYILFIPSRHLKPKSLLVLPPRDAPDVISGLPNNRHPSDHLPIGSDFGIY